MKKSFLTKVHSIVGLFAGIFILLLSVSGTVLVFKDELDSLQKPNVFSAEGNHTHVDTAYQLLKNAYPNAEIASCKLAFGQSYYSFFLYDSLFDNAKAPQEFLIHPNTISVVGTQGGNNFVSQLSKFHSSFNAGKTGEWLLGVFAIVFAVSLFTGIIIYRKNILAVLLLKKGVFKRGNLHQLIGVYALLFNLLMAVTGFWMQRYVFKKNFYTAATWVKQLKPSPQLFFSIDSSLDRTKQLHPTFTPYVIYFAQSTKGNTAVYGSNSTNAFIHSKKFADVIAFDSSGAIAKTRFTDENTAADYYDIVNSQLHMGRYGGWFVKLLYGLFGITGAVLSITGFWLWLKTKNQNSK
jgi:uncharacterized iron-regulated membrane protein